MFCFETFWESRKLLLKKNSESFEAQWKFWTIFTDRERVVAGINKDIKTTATSFSRTAQNLKSLLFTGHKQIMLRMVFFFKKNAHLDNIFTYLYSTTPKRFLNMRVKYIRSENNLKYNKKII